VSFGERPSRAERAFDAAALTGAILFLAGWPAPAVSQPYVPSGRIDPARVNVLSAADARRSAGLSLAFPVSHLKPEVVGWTRSDQSLGWTIDVPGADLYAVNVLIGQTSGPALDLRVSAGGTAVTSPFRPDPRGSYSRSPLEQPLPLAKGRNAVSLHVAPRTPGQPFAAEVLAVELVRPSIRDALHAEAMALRADARWMPRARYGVMFHWTKRTMPRSGPPRSYADAAEAFDVERFASQVASTGAGFVVLTTAHSDQYLPAPIQALDRVLPGRTARRDLIADLIGALGRRGIRLVLYYHLGPIEDPEWARATGLFETDSRRLFDNWQAIVGEVGERYGEELAGWWFDDGIYNYHYRSPDWAALDRAAKRGHPGRAVCFNSWKNTSATEFQDFHCGEELVPDGANAFLNRDGSFGGTLVAGGDGRITRGAFAGLQAVATFMMESEWVHLERDTEAAPPKRSPAQLAELIRRLHAYGATPIINMLIYQDGRIAPRSLASLQETLALLIRE
jgi:hypothetical protein